MKADRDVVLAAIAQHDEALLYAADSFLQDESFAVDARRNLLFLKITTLSGRSCVIALEGDCYAVSSWYLIKESCGKLGLQRTGRESLLYGCLDIRVPGTDCEVSSRSPGWPSLGEVDEYQLVM